MAEATLAVDQAERPDVVTPIGVALAFVALALLLRLPTFLYSVLNYDESMYLLMGDKLRQGFLPYTLLCDLKPVGLFAIFALITSLPLDGVIATRLCAAVTVGLTAFALWRTSGLLFEGQGQLIGTTAGLLYLVFMLASGGQNAQAELFMNGLVALALLLTVQAARSEGRQRRRLVVLTGLVLGLDFQVKQVAVFDAAALVGLYFLLSKGGHRHRPAKLGDEAVTFAAAAVAALLPTIAVILTYVLSGNWQAWVAGNITAHQVFYGADGPAIAWRFGLRVMMTQAPLWLACLVAAVLGWRLVRSAEESRALLGLLVWVALIVACQIFLRYMADHYFLQFVPPLSLIAGFLVGRGLLSRLARSATRRLALAGLVVLLVAGVARNPIANGLIIAHARYVNGEAWAGDAARQVAASLKGDLLEGDAVYVVGFMPVVYYLTGAVIPTGFAFTGLPNMTFPGRDGCPYVEIDTELARILDSRPRFIVVEQGVFFRKLPDELKATLTDRLASDYRLRGSFEQHWAHRAFRFERFVMNGATAAKVYELNRAGATARNE